MFSWSARWGLGFPVVQDTGLNWDDFRNWKKRAQLWKVFAELSPTTLQTNYKRLYFQPSLTIILRLKKKKIFFCLVIFVRREKMLLDQIYENLWLNYVIYILGCFLISEIYKINELRIIASCLPCNYSRTMQSYIWLLNKWHFSEITELLLI